MSNKKIAFTRTIVLKKQNARMKKSIATIGVVASLQTVAASHNALPATRLTETPMGTFTGHLCSTPNCTEYVVPGTTGRFKRKSSFSFLPKACKEDSYECNKCQQRRNLRGSEVQQRLRKDSQALAAELGVEWHPSQGELTDAELQLFSLVGGGSDAQAEKARWNGEVRSGTSLKKGYSAAAKGNNFSGSLADDHVNSTGEGMTAEEEKARRGSTGSKSIFGANKGGNFGDDLTSSVPVNVGSGMSAGEERAARGYSVDPSNGVLDRHGLGGSPAISVGSGESREEEVAGWAVAS